MTFLFVALLSGTYSLSLLSNNEVGPTVFPVVSMPEDEQPSSEKNMQAALLQEQKLNEKRMQQIVMLEQLKYLQEQKALLEKLAPKKEEKKDDKKSASIQDAALKMAKDTLLKGVDLSRTAFIYTGGALIAAFALAGGVKLLVEFEVLKNVLTWPGSVARDAGLQMCDGAMSWWDEDVCTNKYLKSKREVHLAPNEYVVRAQDQQMPCQQSTTEQQVKQAMCVEDAYWAEKAGLPVCAN